MLIRSIPKLVAVMFAAVFLSHQAFAAETQPASKLQADVVKAGQMRANAPTIKTIGKRPPLAAARPGWLANLSGESAFLMRFGAAFDRLDKNKDGLVRWAVVDAQGKMQIDKPGPEPLPASYNACYLIDYVHHLAKKEKDPAHPGQYIETPESYEITGWKTWKEALAEMSGGYPAMSPTGVCNKMEKVPYCKKGVYEMARKCAFGQCNCYNGVNGFTVILKDVCVDKQMVQAAFTKEQWLKVAKDHFKREDWNHDGKLDAVESKEFVCPAE